MPSTVLKELGGAHELVSGPRHTCWPNHRADPIRAVSLQVAGISWQEIPAYMTKAFFTMRHMSTLMEIRG
jgi:hypothetical protein